MSQKKLIKAKVRNTDTIIFEGEVDRISSFNEMGPFDIYAMHANFISIIRQRLVLYNKGQIVKDLKFEQAVMKVKQDLVHIFLGIEILKLEDENAPIVAEAKVLPQK